MRPSKILNLVAFGFDILCACLLIVVASQIILHTCQLGSPQDFANETRNVPGNFNDFRAYYALGRIADSPDKANIMDPAVQHDWYCRVSTPEGASCSDSMPIPYIPFFSVAWLALAKLPLSTSYVVWSMLGVVGFAVSVMLLGLARHPKSSRFAPFVIPLCALASLPVLRCLVLGQSALIVTTFVALYYLCWMRRWDVLAGIFIALTTFKPQFLVFTLIPALAQKRLRILISFVIAEIILFAITAAVLGPKPVIDCFTATARLGTTNWNQTWTMLTIMALYWYLSHTVMLILGSITYIAGLALLVWCWRKRTDTNRLVALTICTCLLISYSQLYDAILLAVPAVLTLAQAGTRNVFTPDWRDRLWWGLLYFYPVFSWGVWLIFGRYNPMSYHSFTLVLIAQTALAASLVLRPPAANPDAPVVAESPQ